MKKVQRKKTKAKAAPKPKPKRAKAPPKETMPWEEDTIPAKLCRLADKLIISIPGLVRLFPEELKKAKIKKITEQDVRQALAIERQWEAHAKNRIWQLGGTCDGISARDLYTTRAPQESPRSATLRALLSGRRVSDELRVRGID